MIKATTRRARSIVRTPGAIVLLSVGAACFTALLLFAPEDVRAWLIGPGAGGAVATVVALFVRLRGSDDDRPTRPPEEP